MLLTSIKNGKQTKKNKMSSLSCMNSVKRSGDKRPAVVRPPAVILFEYIGDRSGSTTTIYSAQMAGLQKCISDRREDAQNTGARCLVSITTFDDDVETFTNEWSEDGSDYADIKNIPEPFSSEQMKRMLKPRGCTRLIDTAYERAISFEKKLKRVQSNLKGADNEKVVAVFALSTDGDDNASRRAVWELNEVVRRLRKSGVEMMFLAANQDAIATGKSFGFAASHAMTFDANPATATAAFNGLSQVTRDASDGLPTPGFSQAMRQSSAPHFQRGGGQSLIHAGRGMNPRHVARPRRNLKMSTCVAYESSSDEEGATSSPTPLTPSQQHLMNISGATSVVHVTPLTLARQTNRRVHFN